MVTPIQGDIWWAEAEDKRRPVLIVTRSEAITVLNAVVVAPITQTVRGIPTEIDLGLDQGLDRRCVASFDSLQPIPRAYLTEKVGRLTIDQDQEICRAIRAMTDC